MKPLHIFSLIGIMMLWTVLAFVAGATWGDRVCFTPMYKVMAQDGMEQIWVEKSDDRECPDCYDDGFPCPYCGRRTPLWPSTRPNAKLVNTSYPARN